VLRVEVFVFHNISSSTLYGVTNPVTEVTKLVTHEESLTLGEAGGGRLEAADGTTEDRGQRGQRSDGTITGVIG